MEMVVLFVLAFLSLPFAIVALVGTARENAASSQKVRVAVALIGLFGSVASLIVLGLDLWNLVFDGL
jgi:hypothetical protein